MEFVAATYFGNYARDELIAEVYGAVNRYFKDAGISLRLLYLGRMRLEPGYLITVHEKESGRKLKLYPIEAVIEGLYSRLLKEMNEDGPLLRGIIGMTTFPLVSRVPYFDFYEKYLGYQETITGLKVMAISIRPFEEELPEGRMGRLLLESRLVKAVLHELGHAFGLKHCENECVMNPPTNLKEWDSRPTNFCQKCMRKIKDSLLEATLPREV